MRNSTWVGMIGTFLLCVLPSRAQDWSRLAHLKHGTLIEVHSVGAPPGLNDRCRLDSVTSSWLSCTWEGDHSTRLVFPAAQVAAVFQVRTSGLRAPTWVLFAGTGIAVAGFATANLAFIGLGAIVVWSAIFAGGSVLPPHERLRIVYLR